MSQIYIKYGLILYHIKEIKWI